MLYQPWVTKPRPRPKRSAARLRRDKDTKIKATRLSRDQKYTASRLPTTGYVA